MTVDWWNRIPAAEVIWGNLELYSGWQKHGYVLPKYCHAEFSGTLRSHQSLVLPVQLGDVLPVQLGGVLQYKREAYCAGFAFLQGLEERKAEQYKRGAYCGTNWRCIAVLFKKTSCTGWGALNSAQIWAIVQ